MGKAVIQCEYCHTIITEKDVVCPKCGANCSEVIKKYREEQNKKDEENEKFVKDIFKKNTNFVRIVGIVMFLIAFVVFFMIFKNIMDSNNRRDNTIKNMYNTNQVNDIKDVVEVQDVHVGYTEEAETADMKVVIDSYELYEYHSDSFQSNNTIDGYQKIAFHFSITNKESNILFTSGLIGLTADNTPVEGAKIELSRGFEEVVYGREKYDSIENISIRSKETINGYLGFLVPKDKQTLEFRIGNNIYITMENPAYQG